MEAVGLATVEKVPCFFWELFTCYECKNCGEYFVCNGYPHAVPEEPIRNYWIGGQLDLQYIIGGNYHFETDVYPDFSSDSTLYGYYFIPGYSMSIQEPK